MFDRRYLSLAVAALVAAIAIVWAYAMENTERCSINLISADSI